MNDSLSDYQHGGSVREREETRRLLAAVVLGLVLFMVTKGPVFRVRLELATVASDFIDDIWVQIAFVVASLLLLAVSWPAFVQIRSDWTAFGFTLAVPALAMISVLWSVAPSRTLEQGVMFFLGTLAALLAGAFVSRLHALVAVFISMQIGVAVSLLAVVRRWPLATDENGKFAGIFFNRNSLGPVALTALAACVVLMLVMRRSNPLVLCALGAAAVVNAYVWYRTGSLTSAVALASATCCTAVLWFGAPRSRSDDRRRRLLAATISAAVVSLSALAYSNRGRIADALGRDPTLAGRTRIWAVVDDYIGRRSVNGWGFFAIWRDAEFTDALAAQNALVYEAHSGYREVALGMGLPALLVLICCLAVALARSGSVAWRTPEPLALWSFGVVLYVVVVNLSETYVGANLLPWTLMSVVVGQAVAARKQWSTDDRESNADNHVGLACRAVRPARH